MARLMFGQWILGILFALFWTPLTWIGSTSQVHIHVWGAIIAGGALSGFTILWLKTFPDAAHTRHVVAVAQMLWSAMLIHLSGGRIETHFHVFASLAILSSYRDWKTLVTATITIGIDHFIRGVFYPLSVFGVAAETPIRWLEHVSWVLFAVAYLVPSCRRHRSEFKELCDRQTELEIAKHTVDQQVDERTQELVQINQLLRKKTNEAEKLAMVARHTDNAVSITDAQGKIEWSNEGFTRITGYSAEEALGRQILDFLHCSETKPEIVKTMREAFRHGDGCNLELVNRRKNGELYWLATEVRPIKTIRGDLNRFIVIDRDISERKNVELSLAQAEQQLRSIFDNVPGAFYRRYLHRDDKSIFMSRWIERITGYPADEFVVSDASESICHIRRRSHLDFIHPEDDARVRKHIETSIQQRGEFSIEYRIVDKNENIRWVWERGKCVDNCDEDPLIDGTVFDITERIEAEQENQKLHQELLDVSRRAGMAEIATGVLHNVGNILNSVNVSASIIRKQLEDSPIDKLERISGLIDEYEGDFFAFVKDEHRGRLVPEYLRRLKDSMQEGRLDMITEFSDLVSNIDHIKAIISVQQSTAKCSGLVQKLDVHDVFRDAISANKASIQRDKIIINQQIDECVPVFVSDKHRILQILINLIKNAIDSLRESGVPSPTVTVTATCTDEWMILSVGDNGVGIPPERLARIFQHGFTTKKTGYGFGLHSSANAAKEIGGVLTGFSDGVGCGATFELKLPSTEASLNESIDHETICITGERAYE
ncbi:PAS domain S-box protein [Rhodopirellula sp. MGV]|uniref:PAS domain S-box protein n=1 Tax=Rhodopirellula sp. MGV TaxID=2023130 RepID=UPI001E3E9767|nr:PAS domain S-box protein [Rhodopirellula sp. MGV]